MNSTCKVRKYSILLTWIALLHVFITECSPSRDVSLAPKLITTTAAPAAITCPTQSICRSRSCCGYMCPQMSAGGLPNSCGIILGLRPVCIDTSANGGPPMPATNCLLDACASCPISSLSCAGAANRCSALPANTILCDFSQV